MTVAGGSDARALSIAAMIVLDAATSGASGPRRNAAQSSAAFPAQSVRDHQDDCDRHEGCRQGDGP